jgi:hypothetical protein
MRQAHDARDDDDNAAIIDGNTGCCNVTRLV